MKISIIFTIFLFLCACSKSHESSSRAVNSTTGGSNSGGGNNEVPPILGSVLTNGSNPDFRPFMGYGGDANTFNSGNYTYVTTQDNNSGATTLRRFNSTELDTAFGSNNLQSGVLPIPDYMIVYSTMCNGSIYALAWHPSFDPQVFKATPGSGTLVFTEISADFMTLLGGNRPDSFYEITCTKDHVFIPMANGGTPQFNALIAINTSTNNLSVFYESPRVTTVIPLFYYSHNNELFYLSSSERKKVTINEGAKTVSFSNDLSLNLWQIIHDGNLAYLSNGKVRLHGFKYSNPSQHFYADLDMNVFHDHISNNDFTLADFETYDFTSPDGNAVDYSNVCFSANGNFAANVSTNINATGFGIYDLTASTTTIYSKFNSGAVKVLTEAPYNGGGSYNSAVVCNGQNMFLFYRNQGRVVFDQYTVPLTP